MSAPAQVITATAATIAVASAEEARVETAAATTAEAKDICRETVRNRERNEVRVLTEAALSATRRVTWPETAHWASSVSSASSLATRPWSAQDKVRPL